MQAVRDPAGIAAQIERIVPGGGTDFLPALEMAHESVRAAPASRKHVIFLSDGQSPAQGLVDLAREMKAEAITVTTVGLGTGCDQALLEEIAHATGGRFFHVSNPNDLVEVFVNELAAARGN
jgi:Mg-chelatase subunit ChlD